MKQTFTTQKRPLYLISGIATIPFAITRLFGDNPEIFGFVIYTLLGISFIIASGYLYAHRKIILEDDRLVIRNINKDRKRTIPFSDILRIWENQEDYIIDLESEVIEIEKAIFHKPKKVSEALAEIRTAS